MTGPTLITGGAGFAAGHLLDRLANRDPLVAWHRPGGTPPTRARGVTWEAVDLMDGEAVSRAIAATSPARIYHLAGAPNVEASFRNVVPHLRVNALGTHHLIEAVRRLTLPCRILVVTSAQIYQPSDDPIAEDAPLLPATPYGLSKLAQDQLTLLAAAEAGLDLLLARPFNHVGPGQPAAFAVPSFARQLARIEAGLAPPELRVGNLDARRDITDVRDVVAAYERLMDQGTSGRAYNVCSGRAWRIRDLLEEMVHLTGSAVSITIDPDRMRPSDVPTIQGDATRIRAELGWTPRIRVEETLSDTLDWWRRETRLSNGQTGDRHG